jgi:hypothetical protein
VNKNAAISKVQSVKLRLTLTATDFVQWKKIGGILKVKRSGAYTQSPLSGAA